MDLNREICSIAYNCLNLPQRIDYQDGSHVLYTYNAGGHKLRTEYFIDQIEQVNHYYPFGGLMGESTNDEVQRYIMVIVLKMF